jgi:hypothetical protein
MSVSSNYITVSDTLFGIPVKVRYNRKVPFVKGKAREIQVQLHTADGYYLYQHISTRHSPIDVMRVANGLYEPGSWLFEETGRVTHMVATVTGYVNGDDAGVREKFRQKSNAIWHVNAKSTR